MNTQQSCQCEGPGWCPRYQREMVGRLYELCSGKCPLERPCPPQEKLDQYKEQWSLTTGQDTQRFRLILNFLRSVVKHAKNWFHRVPENVYQERLAVCRGGCPYYHNDRCQKCGCGLVGQLVAKCRWASEQCPLDPPKWKAWPSSYEKMFNRLLNLKNFFVSLSPHRFLR